MGRRAGYYRGIRGSASIATARLEPGAVAAEALAPGELRRVPFAGELLGAVRVRAGFAALPLEAFDRAGDVLSAEAQGAYLQLLRLAWAEGRNWCRVAKRDLERRLGVSERRLNRILDVLVAVGFLRPLHRDNRGTLWRVYLPAEAFGEPVGDDVLLGKASAPVVRLAARRAAAHAGAAPAAAREPAPAPAPSRAARRGDDAAALARALADARGEATAEALARAAREIQDLLQEGQRPERIAASIETVRRRAARAAREEPT
jgi:hypothetical protein